MHKRRYKGFDYEAQNPKPPAPPEKPKGKWIHKGGGWYENTVTKERRRGK